MKIFAYVKQKAAFYAKKKIKNIQEYNQNIFFYLLHAEKHYYITLISLDPFCEKRSAGVCLLRFPHFNEFHFQQCVKLVPHSNIIMLQL